MSRPAWSWTAGRWWSRPTLVDGLALARSVFNHPVNHRCTMVYGLPDLLADPEDNLAGLRAISEHTVPGQWDYARAPSGKELAVTTVLRLSLHGASVKISQSPPDGDAADLDLDVWAGVVRLRTVRLDPVAAPDLHSGIGRMASGQRGGSGTAQAMSLDSGR